MSRSVGLPPPRRVLQIEAEGLKKEMASAKKLGKSRLVTEWYHELQKRKELFKLLTNDQYETPLDCSVPEKEVLSKIFFGLFGCSWKRNFGYVCMYVCVCTYVHSFTILLPLQRLHLPRFR